MTNWFQWYFVTGAGPCHMEMFHIKTLNLNVIYIHTLYIFVGAGVALLVPRLGYYGLDDRGSIHVRGNNGIVPPWAPRPDRLWGAPSLLSNLHRG